MNIIDKINKIEIKYSELFKMYDSYSYETGDIEYNLRAIEYIISLYKKDRNKYDCDIKYYLNKYREIKCEIHKDHPMILCELEMYSEAINVFQNYIEMNINNNLMKFKLGEYVYFMMLCCILNNDDIALERKYEFIRNAYPILENNFEFRFSNKISELSNINVKMLNNTYKNMNFEKDTNTFYYDKIEGMEKNHNIFLN